mgnify:CR=1 FL=1
MLAQRGVDLTYLSIFFETSINAKKRSIEIF